jgi:hypothetical protein
MTSNPLYKRDDDVPRLLLTKRQAATALAVSTRIVEALEKRGDLQSVQIAPCFPKPNPNARSRRGPQPMKRFTIDSLKAYVARLQESSNNGGTMARKDEYLQSDPHETQNTVDS